MGLDCLTDPFTAEYLKTLRSPLPEPLSALEKRCRKEELPIASSEMTEFLRFLCTLNQPARILEIGTCVGFSTLLMHTFCPIATIDTIERNPVMIRDAKVNFSVFRAKRISLFEGDAAVILPHLTGPYDFIYLDAAKGQYPFYLPECLRLLTEGGVLLSDNVLFRGQVVRGKAEVRRNRTIVYRLQQYLTDLKENPDLTTTVLPISDGVTVSVKRSKIH